jgi:hypothetical protein
MPAGHDRFRRHVIARSVSVSAFGGKMSTDGHLGSDDAFRNRFDDRGWCVDSGVVCLAVMEATASCSYRMRCRRAGRVPDVPWGGATACPSSATARRLLPNSPLYEMNALVCPRRRRDDLISSTVRVSSRLVTSTGVSPASQRYFRRNVDRAACRVRPYCPINCTPHRCQLDRAYG